MSKRLSSKELARLRTRLGEDPWREVSQAAWRATPLKDSRKSAAAAAVARSNARASGLALLAHVLLAASLVGVLTRGVPLPAWLSLVLVVVVGLSTAWALFSTVRSRRAIRVHDANADHERLRPLVEEGRG